MENIVQKYNKLDSSSQLLINKLIDFLSNEKKLKSNKPINYKKRILDVSVWQDEDLKIYDEIKNNLHSWNEAEW